MDANLEKRQYKQPIGQQPYIGDDALRTLARMIAHRLLAEPKNEVSTTINEQPYESLIIPDEAFIDLTEREE